MTFYLILTTYSKVSITISNLKIRKLRLREGKQPSQNHKAV